MVHKYVELVRYEARHSIALHELLSFTNISMNQNILSSLLKCKDIIIIQIKNCFNLLINSLIYYIINLLIFLLIY